MQILPATSGSDASVLRAAELLTQGSIVAFPTETVYGLGANALSASAVQKIYDAKGRPAKNPVIVHVASIDQAKNLTTEWNDIADECAKHFWPGPLTLILQKSSIVPDIVTAGGQTVAIRMPAHPIARALIEACNFPLAGPSANTSGQLSPTTARHVAESLGEKVALILDSGPTRDGIESTVLDTTTTPPRILRPGPITREHLANIGIVVASNDHSSTTDEILRSPGQLASHYAPLARLILAQSDKLPELIVSLQGKKVAFLSHSWKVDANLQRTLPKEASAYAHGLYEALHALDRERPDVILVEELPSGAQWEALQDRLTRAAADRSSVSA